MQVWYRSRQFWRSLGAHLSTADRALVQSQLTATQRELFEAMLPRDQVHALAVYRAVRRHLPSHQDDPDVAAAAFLHDAGKAGTHLWHRVAYVLLQEYAPGLRCWPPPVSPHDFRYPFYVLREHAAISAALAQAAGCNERVVRAILLHHTPPAAPDTGDVLAHALQTADSQW